MVEISRREMLKVAAAAAGGAGALLVGCGKPQEVSTPTIPVPSEVAPSEVAPTPTVTFEQTPTSEVGGAYPSALTFDQVNQSVGGNQEELKATIDGFSNGGIGTTEAFNDMLLANLGLNPNEFSYATALGTQGAGGAAAWAHVLQKDGHFFLPTVTVPGGEIVDADLNVLVGDHRLDVTQPLQPQAASGNFGLWELPNPEAYPDAKQVLEVVETEPGKFWPIIVAKDASGNPVSWFDAAHGTWTTVAPEPTTEASPTAIPTPDVVEQLDNIPVSLEVSPELQGQKQIRFSDPVYPVREHPTDLEADYPTGEQATQRLVRLALLWASPDFSEAPSFLPQDVVTQRLAEAVKNSPDGLIGGVDPQKGVRIILESWQNSMQSQYAVPSLTGRGQPDGGARFEVIDKQLVLHVAVNFADNGDFNICLRTALILFAEGDPRGDMVVWTDTKNAMNDALFTYTPVLMDASFPITIQH